MSRVHRFLDPRLLAPIVDDAGRVGGKARSLARLAALGLPVPEGFVVVDAVARSWLPPLEALPTLLEAAPLEVLAATARAIERAPGPEGFDEALAQAVAALGAGRLAVRSSFAAEDREGALAAGVYESEVDVPPDQVARAVRRVVASAISAGALAYAARAGARPAEAPVAVLVHGFEPGQAAGHVAAAPSTGAGSLWVRTGALDEPADARLRADVVRVANAVGAPVELEWLWLASGPRYLQMRPFVPTPLPPPEAWPGWADLPEDENRTAWRWDAAHNPAPLSPAHAGLVAWVDERCRIGYRQRVLGGYLFYRRDERGVPPAQSVDEAREVLDALGGRVEGARAAWSEAPPLEAALALFASVYEPLLGVVGPAARNARDAFARLVQALPSADAGRLLAGVPSAATRRRDAALAIARAPDEASRDRAVAAYLDQFGDEASEWDVAAPTLRERPADLVARVPAPRAEPSSPHADASVVRATLDARRAAELLADARAAVALAEDDDALYARVQAPVRQALLALGRRLVTEGALAVVDDVFFVPLGELRALAGGGGVAANELRVRVAEGRAAVARALAAPPPSSSSARADAQASGVLRGHGTGGRVLGRVVIHDRAAAAPPPADAILVARTILPTELPLLRVAAVVTETGGPLDHVAAQARERGLPAVVGVGSVAVLADGDRVLVDADRGEVVRLP